MKRVGFKWVSRGSCKHPEIMTIKSGSLCSVEFPAYVGVITHPDLGVIFFDTGYDEAFIEATNSFPERFYRWATPVKLDPSMSWSEWLEELNVEPDHIHGIVLSHFHGDHVAGLRNFEGLPVYCSSEGLSEVRRLGRLSGTRKGILKSLVPTKTEENVSFFEETGIVELPSAFAPFKESRDILGDGSLLAVELPGHCKGHWGLALRSEEEQYILLAADAIWTSKSLEKGMPPPRLTTAFLGNTKSYRATLAELFEAKNQNNELHILPSHCPIAAAKLDNGS